MKAPLLFKSHDPLWPYWGVSSKTVKTEWFRLKSDAEKFIKTGIPKGAY